MSILNLNAPQGRGPIGKKKTKIWMGVGLLAAVLGFGSTFAASITLNQPGGTTEFGQGVTQTVYCGGNQSVTITPLSSYSNTTVGAGTPGQEKSAFNAKFIKSYSSATNYQTTLPKVKLNKGSSGLFPQISGSNDRYGWWLKGTGTSSGSAIWDPQPSLAEVRANPSQYYFSEASSSSSITYKRGNSESSNSESIEIVVSDAVAPIPGATTPASFAVGGILISNIPSACDGVDFVVSAYQETGGPASLIGDVKEVAVNWTRSTGVAVSSSDRSTYTPSNLIDASQTINSIKILFDTDAGSALSATNLYKLIVETQEGSIA